MLMEFRIQKDFHLFTAKEERHILNKYIFFSFNKLELF